MLGTVISSIGSNAEAFIASAGCCVLCGVVSSTALMGETGLVIEQPLERNNTSLGERGKPLLSVLVPITFSPNCFSQWGDWLCDHDVFELVSKSVKWRQLQGCG